ncbi:MAG: shikimate dehydrogenase [Phenylobacterium sp.]|jgi:shikimate dehydrogenase|uniref:shikimate dehydrogenase n=1 Tax=Phenylobacterium sp. TaxID=1871053 RepID=UPI002A3669D9|nr:shikimate dehydrogenase [Phenylobacterium sp.]MDX9998201.1 shikimate dehydrogenase [Phenylobacterium sp.]
MITGATLVAGVAGAPVRHSLSPMIHNAWLAGAGIDGVYVPFSPPADGFVRFVNGLRGGAVRGINVTLPFKEEALMAADDISPRAELAGAANLLVFSPTGMVLADNTDGLGLLHAFAVQAPGFDPAAGPVAILGAGGAARGAAAAFAQAGCPQVRIINRTFQRAEEVAGTIGPVAAPYPLDRAAEALAGVNAVINATSVGLSGQGDLAVPLGASPDAAVVMDMVYKPLKTAFLARAEALGRRTVDGLEMLIGQAIPSFEAFYGRPPPPDVDVRALCLEALVQ